jgi:LacI family transcriptional regulator
MSDREGRVTLKMIAAQAGVSIGTVARALNNHDGINRETRRRILDIAGKLKYHPNKLAGALARKKLLCIGIAYAEESRDFYSLIDDGITNAALVLEDFGVTVEKIRYESQNPEVEYARLNSLDTTKFDGLAINSAGPSIESLIDRFVNSGLPVITFNTDAVNSSRLFYVGSNTRRSGMMSAEMLAMMMCNTGKVAVLGDFTRASPFMERFGGFCEYMQINCPDIQIHPCAHVSSNSEAMARRLVEQINLIPDISGVFCTGYTSTIGALEALNEIGGKHIHIVGYDVTSRTAEAVRNNKINALIFQDPYQQGYQAAYLLAQHLIDGYLPPKPYLYIEDRIVIKSNLDAYVKV